MTKELLVSSTPHETKVGLTEDDQLAEIYLERENEYTLAGSIYKGRVTRVLPGMQSAFVDIGLERDSFLYVSDFMELEEHDDDLTDVVPAGRPVQDMRPQPARAEAGPETVQVTDEGLEDAAPELNQEFAETEASDAQPQAATAPEFGNAADQGRDRFRGRRRRRGGRRDGRERGPDRGGDRGGDRGSERSGNDRGSDRVSEPRFSRPVEPVAPRPQEFNRTQPSGPPQGYTPMVLPGESISKYRGYTPPPAVEPVHEEVQ